jgi:type I restriction enzyme S subunit
MSVREWKEVKLGDVCEFQEGYVNPSQKKPEYFGDEIKWVRANDLTNGYVFATSRKLSRAGFESAGKSALLFEPDTIVISKSGTIGRLGIIKDYMCGNRATINIRTNKDVADYRYIFYYLLRNQAEIDDMAVGSVQRNLYTSILSSIPLTFPPIKEQKAIADTLSCLDDKIELNNRINKNLEEIAQAIFKSWFVDFEPFQDGEFEDSELGRIPKGWRVGTIEEFVKEMKNGGTPNRKNDNYWDSKDVPWLKTGEIKNSLIIESEEYISWAGLKNSSAKILPYNSVLMAMYGATAGKIGLLKFEASTNQACCAMTCNSANKAIFLYLFLLANQSYIESLAVGAAQQNLNKDTISKLKLIIPKDEVIESVIFDELFNYIENNFRETQKLNAIRDTLLPKLMSGEIRVPIEEVQ